MKSLTIIISCLCLCHLMTAQSPAADTVIVQLAKTSQMTLTIQDPRDLEILQHYDFDALFEDMLTRLAENHDIELGDDPDEDFEVEDVEYDESDEDFEDEDEEEYEDEEEGDDADDDEEDEDYDEDMEDDEAHGSWDDTKDKIFGLANIDFGIGNYISRNFTDLSDSGDEQYTVRPWGSWYLALNSVYHTHIKDDFHINWGVGVSWYNFKFQDDRTVLTEVPGGAVFTRDTRDLEFIKSKLTVTYINATILPIIQFGRHRDHAGVLREHHRDFRLGAGVYGGYRLGSYTKQVYEEDDDREKERERNNFSLNNLRYGVRVQFGIHNTDFFFNYDLNQLFAENRVSSDGRNVKLNAYSFGILF